MATIAERLHELFAGLETSHGRYIVPEDAKPDPKKKGKIEGRPWTEKRAATADDWKKHLEGARQFGIGLSPIRADGMCSWGAVDVDAYDLDLPKLNARVRASGLPLVLCRTKSGGAHLYLFLVAPCPAELVQAKLKEFAAALGFAGSEVFPKQTRLPTEEDYGNWINMPYQRGRQTARYAFGESDQPLTAEEFLDLAEGVKVDEDELRGLTAKAVPPAGGETVSAEQGDDFEGAPPCLQTLAARGFPEFRNNAFFGLCVYLKKRFPEEWRELALEYNDAYFAQPLSAEEAENTVASIAKKDYSYKCKDQPVCDVCDKEVCKLRDFGVGGGALHPGGEFGALVKIETDPPLWVWEVNGAKVELGTEEVLNQSLFNRKVMEKTNQLPQLMKGPRWQQFVRDALDSVVVVDVPVDATREGQWREHLQAFCTGRSRARSIDEVLLGKPFKDDERGRTFFRSSDFIAYLQQHRVTGTSERTLYAWLRREGMEPAYQKLKGKGVNMWSVRSFEEQTEEHAVPRAKTEDM